ncbi:MAG: hypothetical protein NC548_42335 [Lachnospiraceae bacterium]|nr:hypothetical protein [Lachnospiraceae bacterium]
MEIITKTGIYIKNGEEHTFEFKTNLRAKDKVKFINNVTDIIVGDNYYPVIRDLIFDYSIISIFTDVDVYSINTSPDFLSDVDDLVNGTDIVDVVKANAVEGLIEELNNAIDKNIEFKTGIHKEVFADNLSNLFKMIESKIAEVDMETIMKTADKLNSVSGQLTPEKLIEAYSQSDMFKNLSEKNKI